MENDKILTKDFILNATITMFCAMNFFMLMVNLVEFSQYKFDATAAQAGIVTGLYVIGGLASRVLFGKYVELVGRKKMLLLSLVGEVIMSLMYFFVSSLTILYIIRFLHGMMYGVNTTCGAAIASKLIPEKRKGEGLGYYAIAVTISTAIGPLIGVNLVNGNDYTMVFVAGLLMNVIGLICGLLLKVEEENLTEKEVKEAKSFKFSDIFFVPALPLSIVCMVFYLSYSGILSFISSYGDSMGLNVVATYFYITLALATLVSRLTTGKIYDKHGPNIIVIPGFILFTVGMLLFSVSTSILMFMISSILIGYAISSIYSVAQAIIIRRATVQKYGVASSTYTSLVDMGSGFGPMLLGIILPITGFSTMYVICAAIGFVCMFAYWGVHGHKAYREKHTSA